MHRYLKTFHWLIFFYLCIYAFEHILHANNTQKVKDLVEQYVKLHFSKKANCFLNEHI